MLSINYEINLILSLLFKICDPGWGNFQGKKNIDMLDYSKSEICPTAIALLSERVISFSSRKSFQVYTPFLFLLL